MLFNSLEFAVFFPLVTLAYFLVPFKARWFVLLLASCLFYAAFIPKFLFVMAYLIVVDYCAGLAIERSEGKRRRAYLIASLLSNLGTLFFFKYFHFFQESVGHLATLFKWNYSATTLSVLLPIGLSFHTFQSIAYTIEVYRGRQRAERHFGIFALYVMFYPQLVAGPIERPQRVLHQFHRPHPLRWTYVRSGLLLMAWGLFKKMAVADRIAPIVGDAFDSSHGHGAPGEWHGLQLLLASYLFAFQIYGDFSGYSDIARGAARVMGFRLSKNFDLPFSSRSIAEFWSRWHISLSSWFRDYLYMPLALSGIDRPWLAVAYIPIVFALSGLWHGANWTFLAWGALHGAYATAEHFLHPAAGRVWNWIRRLVVFNLVAIAWVFFRAKGIDEAERILTSILVTPFGTSGLGLPSGLAARELAELTALVCLMLVFEQSGGFTGLLSALRRRSVWIRWPVVTAAVWLILLLAAKTGAPAKEFIYFQF
jgi:D-alanyl-lipoteichoic acid acyltransferase DltB (MBOAT superfamily)